MLLQRISIQIQIVYQLKVLASNRFIICFQYYYISCSYGLLYNTAWYSAFWRVKLEG